MTRSMTTWEKLALLIAAFFILAFFMTPAEPPAPIAAAPAENKEEISTGKTRQEIREEEKASDEDYRGKRKDGVVDWGYDPNPVRTQEFLKSLSRPTLSQAGPDLMKNYREGEPVLLYRPLFDAYKRYNGGKQWVVGKQGIGDCVSWGWAHGCDFHLAVMWRLGNSAEWKPAATESIYGGSRVESPGVNRGGYSDGSYGGAAAKWVKEWGVTFRQPYPELNIDLSEYSSSRAKQWGNFGNGGEDDNGRFDTVAKKHPVRNVALVRNFKEAAAAISSGYPVPVCSGQGFSSTRDEKGFCRPSGSWAHCMCFIGVRHDRPGLLCLNSWGPDWVGGPKWPEDQPDGSFWVDEATATRMLSGSDSFAVSGYEGFPYRKISHLNWAMANPPSPKQPAIFGPVLADSAFGLSLAP